MFGVAVRQECGGKNVALRGAGGQSSRRADALDIPDYARNFRVVRKARELGHQRDTRPGGRGHGACSSPSGADDHADRGQFVFGLDDGERGLAISADAKVASNIR